jgi:hypothetical protein
MPKTDNEKLDNRARLSCILNARIGLLHLIFMHTHLQKPLDLLNPSPAGFGCDSADVNAPKKRCIFIINTHYKNLVL